MTNLHINDILKFRAELVSNIPIVAPFFLNGDLHVIHAYRGSKIISILSGQHAFTCRLLNESISSQKAITSKTELRTKLIPSVHSYFGRQQEGNLQGSLLIGAKNYFAAFALAAKEDDAQPNQPKFCISLDDDKMIEHDYHFGFGFKNWKFIWSDQAGEEIIVLDNSNS